MNCFSYEILLTQRPYYNTQAAFFLHKSNQSTMATQVHAYSNDEKKIALTVVHAVPHFQFPGTFYNSSEEMNLQQLPEQEVRAWKVIGTGDGDGFPLKPRK